MIIWLLTVMILCSMVVLRYIPPITQSNLLANFCTIHGIDRWICDKQYVIIDDRSLETPEPYQDYFRKQVGAI